MLETSKIFLSNPSSDLNCPICYCPFGLEANQPISTNCGHTICLNCFDKVSRCPFCKESFDKRRHKHQKSVFITDLIANSAKINKCEQHSEICQGFCLQDKKFVCFDCVMQNHQGHKIITIKNLNEKAEKVSAVLQKARKKKESKQLELQSSLDIENKRQKRQLDEIIDQEISYLSLLKKKLYKEVDIRIMSEKEKYDHQFLSENLSKHCSSIEKLLSDWNRNQDVTLANQILEAPSEEIQGLQSFESQVEVFKAEITNRHVKELGDTLKSLNCINHSSAKFKKLFLPNKKISMQNFPQAELDYLIGVFSEYNFTALQKNEILELKVNNTTGFTPKFDPSYFTCFLSKVSLSFSDSLPSINFQTICQILQNIQALKDVTFHLQNLTGQDLTVLFHLISNLRPLEKFSVQMNLTETCKSAVTQFMNGLLSLRNLFSIDIQHKDPQTIISFQLTKGPPEDLHEICLNLGGVPEIVSETLNTLNESQRIEKSLKILKLSLGKTECSSQVLDAVCMVLELYHNLEELNFICEDLNDSTDSDLLLFLSAATQKKKLGVFINKVSISNGSLTTRFLPKGHPCLESIEEFTLKIKYGGDRVYRESFECLVDFLSTAKALKKIWLSFDGALLYFDSVCKLFGQIVQIKTLVALEVEFMELSGLNRYDQRDLESVLKRLPGTVTKKVVFQMSNSRAGIDYDSDDDYDDDDLDGGPVEDDLSYRDHDDDDEEADDEDGGSRGFSDFLV